MDKTEISNTNQRCRTCLNCFDIGLHHLQETYENPIDGNVQNILQLLQKCASIPISTEDGLPQFICTICLSKADNSYKFRIQCEMAAFQLCSELETKVLGLDKQNSSTQTQTTTNVQRVIKQPDKIKKEKCDECDKEFKYRTSLMKHKRKHNKLFSSSLNLCVFCNEPQATASLLARHMEQMHAHLKTIKCAECDKAFFKVANLKLHMNVHSGVKKHMCEVCGVSFALAGNLAAHRRLHTGSKPYICKQCGKGFTQQAALRSHEAGHSNRKDHVCSDCGAAFSRPGALRNHCKRHSPIRPFVCSLCGKGFTFSSERKRHMTIHTGEKNHECEVCGSRFNRSTNLAVHRRIHTGEMPHACSVCGRRFTQAHCLRTHMCTHTDSINK